MRVNVQAFCVYRNLSVTCLMQAGILLDAEISLLHYTLNQSVKDETMRTALLMVQRFKPGWEKHLNAERISVSHEHQLQWCLLKQTDVSFYVIVWERMLHKTPWGNLAVWFLIVKWLYFKHFVRHLQIWGSTSHFHATHYLWPYMTFYVFYFQYL